MKNRNSIQKYKHACIHSARSFLERQSHLHTQKLQKMFLCFFSFLFVQLSKSSLKQYEFFINLTPRRKDKWLWQDIEVHK